MSRDGIKILLGSLKYKSAPNSNLTIPIPFEQNVKELIQYDRISNVDLVQVYNDERNLSKIYRPTFKLDLLFKNVYVGSTNYPPFENNLYYVNENKAAYLTCSVINDNRIPMSAKTNSVIWSGYPQYNEFDFIRTDYNVTGYTKGPGIPNNFLLNGLDPITEQINFNFKSAGTYNWEFYLTYPFSSTTLEMNAYFDPKEPGAQPGDINWNANEGIPFRITVGYDDNVTYQGTRVIRFSSPVKHELSPGEFVKLKIYIQSNINTNQLPYSAFSSSLDTFQVFSLGNGQYGTDDYVFNIANLGYTGATFTQDGEGVAKRVISIENTGDTTSKYYVRLHKVLVPPEEIILTKAGFENNIFGINKKYESYSTTPDYKSRVSIKEGAQTYNITLNKDLDTSNIFDNQKRPISELFLTTIWKGYLGWTYAGPKMHVGDNPAYLKRGWDYNLGMKNSLTEIYVKFPINTTGDTTEYADIPKLEREFIKASVPLPQAIWGAGVNSGFTRSNIRFTSYTKNEKTFYYVNSLKKDDIIDGDFCEWNESEQIERVISKVNHKIYFNPANFSFYPYITANVELGDDDFPFNVQMPNIQPTEPFECIKDSQGDCTEIAVFTGATAFTSNTIYNDNPYGYYYNPHNSIKIKEFSEYIETAERSVLDIPNYAYFSKSQNLFIWRDFLPYGINNPNSNGINYPFVNNAHYPYTSINFRLIPEGTTYWYDNTTTQDSPITDNCE